MYGRLYDKFQDWLERVITNASIKAMSHYYTWAIPELSRIPRESDRIDVFELAITYIPPPRGWWRLVRILVFAVLLMFGVLVADWIAPPNKYLIGRLCIWLLGACAGILIYPFAFLWWQIEGTRQAVYDVLSCLEESICPKCGYDLSGHLDLQGQAHVRCSECGERVPIITPSSPKKTGTNDNQAQPP